MQHHDDARQGSAPDDARWPQEVVDAMVAARDAGLTTKEAAAHLTERFAPATFTKGMVCGKMQRLHMKWTPPNEPRHQRAGRRSPHAGRRSHLTSEPARTVIRKAWADGATRRETARRLDEAFPEHAPHSRDVATYHWRKMGLERTPPAKCEWGPEALASLHDAAGRGLRRQAIAAALNETMQPRRPYTEAAITKAMTKAGIRNGCLAWSGRRERAWTDEAVAALQEMTRDLPSVRAVTAVLNARFSRGRALYGLHMVRDEMRRRGIDTPGRRGTAGNAPDDAEAAERRKQRREEASRGWETRKREIASAMTGCRTLQDLARRLNDGLHRTKPYDEDAAATALKAHGLQTRWRRMLEDAGDVPAETPTIMPAGTRWTPDAVAVLRETLHLPMEAIVAALNERCPKPVPFTKSIVAIRMARTGLSIRAARAAMAATTAGRKEGEQADRREGPQ